MSVESCPDCGHEHAGARLGGICVGCACPWRSPVAVAAAQRVKDAEWAILGAASTWEIYTAFPPIGPDSEAAHARAVEELRAAVVEWRAAMDARSGPAADEAEVLPDASAAR